MPHLHWCRLKQLSEPSKASTDPVTTESTVGGTRVCWIRCDEQPIDNLSQNTARCQIWDLSSGLLLSHTPHLNYLHNECVYCRPRAPDAAAKQTKTRPWRQSRLIISFYSSTLRHFYSFLIPRQITVDFFSFPTDLSQVFAFLTLPLISRSSSNCFVGLLLSSQQNK